MFDVTTIAQWRGPAVGIVRVERELARRARRYLGRDAGFCIYDRLRGVILEIDEHIADELVAGRILVDFENKIVPPPQNTTRRWIRSALQKNATVYGAYHRIRGRRFSRDQILEIKARSEVKSTSLENLPHRPAALDAETTIISAGLDWNYKDLRVLWLIKQLHGFRYCSVIYDLIPILAPQFVIPDYVDLLTDYFGELTWVADQVMCISEATKQEWLDHAYQLGAESVPSAVFPLGCDLPVRPKQPAARLPHALHGKKFAIYVATIEVRKNHRMLYEAWEECLRTNQVDSSQCRLVFVGRPGWATGDLLREVQTNPLTKDTILLLHDVSDEQLAALYEACSFVLFPSMYEGFGLPLAEALGYGKLCISSNAGALAEIGGELVMRLDCKDTLLWSRTISRLFTSPEEVQAWEDRIRTQYRPITWDDAARIFFGKIIAAGHNSRLAKPVLGRGAATAACAASVAYGRI